MAIHTQSASTVPARVFVSYQRSDAAGWAGRLCDRLAERFGAESVFQDVDAIAPGADFAEEIAGFIASCQAVIVVIGAGCWTQKGPMAYAGLD